MAGENNENEENPFNEENLQDILSSPTPEQMDFNLFDNPPPPPPPPNTEINQNDQFLEELTQEAINDISLDDDTTLYWWDMFEQESDDVNNNNFPEENGNGNVGEITRLEVNTRVFGENRMNFDTGGPSTIPVLEENGNGNGAGNNVGETTRLEVSTRVFGENRMIFETGGPSTRPVPVTPVISDGILLCTCCNLLRRLVHTSGLETMQLDIHGGFGFFCHAILEIRGFGHVQYQTINLMELGMEGVMNYIEDYLTARAASGFELLTDTNDPFYQAMNAGSNPNQSIVPKIPPRGEDIPMSLAIPNITLNVPPVPSVPQKERPRRQTPLALQRERTSNMTLEDFSKYFSLPMEEAARKMSVCPTVVKNICRKEGLKRWPHRKIRSLERKVFALRSVLRTAKNPAVRRRAEEEIQRLETEIARICNEALNNLNQ